MYMAIDGDSVGIKLQQLILEERLEDLTQFSNAIKETLQRFVYAIEEHDGIVYMSGGDNIFAEGNRECVQAVALCVQMENTKNQLRYSMAAGESTQDVYLGLKYAKSCKRSIEVVRKDIHMEFKQMMLP